MEINTIRKFITIFLLAVALLVNHHIPTIAEEYVLKDDQIPIDIRNEVMDLYTSINGCIQSNDLDSLSELSHLMEDKVYNDLAAVAQSLAGKNILSPMDTVMWHIKTGNTDLATIQSELFGNPILLNVYTMEQEQVYCFSRYDDGIQTLAILTTYIYMNEEWKLLNYIVDGYAIEGMDAPMLFSKASECLEKNDVLSSYVYSVQLLYVLNPCTLLDYADTDRMELVYEQSTKKLSESISSPITVRIGSDEYMLHSIASSIDTQGIVPVFKFVSVNSDNTLQRENCDIFTTQILDLYPDIKSNFKHIVIYLYDASMNEYEHYYIDI